MGNPLPRMPRWLLRSRCPPRRGRGAWWSRDQYCLPYLVTSLIMALCLQMGLCLVGAGREPQHGTCRQTVDAARSQSPEPQTKTGGRLMDNVPVEVRSRIMRSVRSKGNRTTEAALGTLLWCAGFRGYRKQWSVEGHPDFAWPGLKIAVFVDGCFWHGCHCRTIPKSNRAFWRDKIEKNRLRDLRITRLLRKKGWLVVRIKECDVSSSRSMKRIAVAIGWRRAQTSQVPSVT